MGYEIEVVHPATAEWLTANGYIYEYEFITPLGKIDFVARHNDGHCIFVECKSSASDYLTGLRQLADYSKFLGENYQPVLCVPSSEKIPVAQAACEKRGVRLLVLTIANDKKPSRATKTENRVHKLIVWFFIQKLLLFHKWNNTSPLDDLIHLSRMVDHSPMDNQIEILEMIHNEIMVVNITIKEGATFWTQENLIDFVFKFI